MIKLKIGIVPNLTRKKALEVTQNTIKYLSSFNIEFLLDESCSSDFSEYNIKFSKDIYGDCDIIIAIGGDGSFIHTAKQASMYNKPVLCINAGNLAFLAGLEYNELKLIKKLITGDYSTDKRMMLQVEVICNNKIIFKDYCLNDIVVARGNQIKLIELDVYCDKRKVNRYRSDGIIISTPTGSTAYSWSAGGPVIDPNLRCLMLTPICTHSPLNRSLVFNDNSSITIRPSSYMTQEIAISTDGNTTVNLPPQCEIVIKKSELSAEFIRIKADEFFDILNSKLTQRRIY